MGLCVDTNILIALLRGDQQVINFLRKTKQQIVTTVIVEYELWAGEKKEENLSQLLRGIPVFELTRKSARLAGAMFKDLRKKGKIVDPRDIFIAAICIEQKTPLYTLNRKHFTRLQEYGLEMFPKKDFSQEVCAKK